MNVKKGIFWTGIEKVLVNGVTFVQGVWLARLLGPEDFGLSAMLGIFLTLGSVLADSGLSTALVVFLPTGSRPEKVRGLEHRAWRWNMCVALSIYALLLCGAPAIASWYRQPILMPLMAVMALNIILNAASVVAVSRLTRSFSFGKLAGINGVCSITSAAVAILLAYAGWGVWSIAGMGLTAAVLKMLLVWGAARCKEDGASGPSDDAEFRPMLGYGVKLMVSGAIHLFYLESYSLLIGKLWNPTWVGLFSRGQRWARLPGDIVNESVCRVALPQLANSRVREAWRIGWMNALLLWPGLIILFVWAEAIVSFALGPKWLDCVPYLKWIVIGQFFTPISNVALLVLRAKGRAAEILKTDMIKKPLSFAALGIGASWGLPGLCGASIANDVIETIVDVIFMWRCHRVGRLEIDHAVVSARSEEKGDL